jgi:hypothetical protein
LSQPVTNYASKFEFSLDNQDYGMIEAVLRKSPIWLKKLGRRDAVSKTLA